MSTPRPPSNEERAARIGSTSDLRTAVIAGVTALIVGLVSGVISGQYARNTAQDGAKAASEQAREDYLRGERQRADEEFLGYAGSCRDAVNNYSLATEQRSNKGLPFLPSSPELAAAEKACHLVDEQVNRIQILGSGPTFQKAFMLRLDLKDYLGKTNDLANKLPSTTLLGPLSLTRASADNSLAGDINQFVWEAQQDVQHVDQGR